MREENVLIRLCRRRYDLTAVTELHAKVQIFGLVQGPSHKYNNQVAQVVKELESGRITVMLLEPTFDRKLLLLSPLHLVPHVAEDQAVVSIATIY